MLIKLNDISCASQARACIFCLSSKKSTLGSSYWTDAHKPSTTIPIKSAVNLLFLTSFCWSNDTANPNRYPRKEGETEDFHYGSKSFDGILFFGSLTCQQGFLSYSDKLGRILSISLQMPSTNVIIFKVICNNPISHWVSIWLSNSISKH